MATEPPAPPAVAVNKKPPAAQARPPLPAGQLTEASDETFGAAARERWRHSGHRRQPEPPTLVCYWGLRGTAVCTWLVYVLRENMLSLWFRPWTMTRLQCSGPLYGRGTPHPHLSWDARTGFDIEYEWLEQPQAIDWEAVLNRKGGQGMFLGP